MAEEHAGEGDQDEQEREERHEARMGQVVDQHARVVAQLGRDDARGPRLRGDGAAEKQASEKLDEILARDPNNPAASQIIARRKLQSAQEALTTKDFPKAISEIESNQQRFTERIGYARELLKTKFDAHEVVDEETKSAEG